MVVGGRQCNTSSTSWNTPSQNSEPEQKLQNQTCSSTTQTHQTPLPIVHKLKCSLLQSHDQSTKHPTLTNFSTRHAATYWLVVIHVKLYQIHNRSQFLHYPADGIEQRWREARCSKVCSQGLQHGRICRKHHCSLLIFLHTVRHKTKSQMDNLPHIPCQLNTWITWAPPHRT